jgi:hypothetical protein
MLVEIQPGDAIFFLGRLFTHNAIDIEGASRNIVDIFSHITIINWHEKQKRNKSGEGDMKGKGKQMVEDSDDNDDSDEDYDLMRKIIAVDNGDDGDDEYDPDEDYDPKRKIIAVDGGDDGDDEYDLDDYERMDMSALGDAEHYNIDDNIDENYDPEMEFNSLEQDLS